MDGPRYVWADVLIGSTIAERNFQAAVMRTVLEHADELTAWLGPSNVETPAAFDVIRTMSHRWQQACFNAGIEGGLGTASMSQLDKLREKLITHSDNELQLTNETLWQEVNAVLTSSYFNSVQAIPDIVLAKRTNIRRGELSLTWHEFVRGFHAALFLMPALRRNTYQDVHNISPQINAIDVAKRRYRTDEGVELLPMIVSSRCYPMKDPRESVFSMLPIARPSKRRAATGYGQHAQLPVANYSKSVEDVFKDAARYVVCDRQDAFL